MNDFDTFDQIRLKHEQHQLARQLGMRNGVSTFLEKVLTIFMRVIGTSCAVAAICCAIVFAWNVVVWSTGHLDWIVRIGIALIVLDWGTNPAPSNRVDNSANDIGQLGVVLLGFALLIWVFRALLPDIWIEENYISLEFLL